jgi:hypothetical protein
VICCAALKWQIWCRPYRGSTCIRLSFAQVSIS